MLLGGLFCLLCIDATTPESNVSWLNSLTFVIGLTFFVLMDLHSWRNRSLAASMAIGMTIVTCANIWWDTQCSVSALVKIFPTITSLNKCDVRRSLNLSFIICLIDGLLTMIFDIRNNQRAGSIVD